MSKPKPVPTVAPTGDTGSWGAERADRMHTERADRIDHKRERAQAQRDARRSLRR